MTNDEKHWSYDDDIPDGTDWDEILWNLRWLARQYVTRSQGYFGVLEAMMLDEISDKRQWDRENMLQIATHGKEGSKPLTIYLNKISEYILRLRDKDETDT